MKYLALQNTPPVTEREPTLLSTPKLKKNNKVPVNTALERSATKQRDLGASGREA